MLEVVKRKDGVVEADDHPGNVELVDVRRGKAFQASRQIVREQPGRTALKRGQISVCGCLPFVQTFGERVEAVGLSRLDGENFKWIGSQERIAAEPRVAQCAIEEQAIWLRCKSRQR